MVPKQGIVDLSFQLAPEATLGTYSVAVADGKTFVREPKAAALNQ